MHTGFWSVHLLLLFTMGWGAKNFLFFQTTVMEKNNRWNGPNVHKCHTGPILCTWGIQHFQSSAGHIRLQIQQTSSSASMELSTVTEPVFGLDGPGLGELLRLGVACVLPCLVWFTFLHFCSLFDQCWSILSTISASVISLPLTMWLKYFRFCVLDFSSVWCFPWLQKYLLLLFLVPC